MLARYVHKLMHMQLSKRAVSSLEYAMILMVVVVASVGAVSTSGLHTAPALMQLASAK